VSRIIAFKSSRLALVFEHGGGSSVIRVSEVNRPTQSMETKKREFLENFIIVEESCFDRVQDGAGVQTSAQRKLFK